MERERKIHPAPWPCVIHCLYFQLRIISHFLGYIQNYGILKYFLLQITISIVAMKINNNDVAHRISASAACNAENGIEKKRVRLFVGPWP